MTLLLLMIVASTVFIGVHGARASSPASGRQTFVDIRHGLSITVQLEPTAFDAGMFVFRVPGLGSYKGDARAAMRVEHGEGERGVVHIEYRGPATLGPNPADPTATVKAATSVQVTLDAQFDTLRATGEAQLTHGEREFELHADAVKASEALPTMRAFEKAILGNDPTSLYSIMSGDVTEAHTPDQFAALWRSQAPAIGQLTAMRRVAVSDAQTNTLGFVFVVATYDVDLTAPAGARKTARFDVYLVREPTGWKILFSTAR
jgi:hypothetical protein